MFPLRGRCFGGGLGRWRHSENPWFVGQEADEIRLLSVLLHPAHLEFRLKAQYRQRCEHDGGGKRSVGENEDSSTCFYFRGGP